jgi:hypothetical protein
MDDHLINEWIRELDNEKQIQGTHGSHYCS